MYTSLQYVRKVTHHSSALIMTSQWREACLTRSDGLVRAVFSPVSLLYWLSLHVAFAMRIHGDIPIHLIPWLQHFRTWMNYVQKLLQSSKQQSNWHWPSVLFTHIHHHHHHSGWRRSVLVSALSSSNVVNRHWARLLLGWVTAHGQVNRLGIITSHIIIIIIIIIIQSFVWCAIYT